MYFSVHGYDGRGVPVRFNVDADSVAEARALSRLPSSRIERVQRAYLASFIESLNRVRLSVDDQALFLAQLGAAITSGQKADHTFRFLMRGQRGLKGRMDAIGDELLVSRRLAKLNFDPQAILLAEVGEHSNSLGESLQLAAEEMLNRRDLLNEVKKGMLPGLMLVVLGIGLMMGTALFIAPVLTHFAGESGLNVPLNFAAHTLLNINAVLRNDWPILAAVVVGLFLIRRMIWQQLADKPVFRSIHEYFKLQRGMRFVTAFQPLFDAGVGTRKILEQLAKTGSRRDAAIYLSMKSGLAKGVSLSVMLDRGEWPRVVRQGFQNFEAADKETQGVILKTQTRLIKTRSLLSATWMRRVMYAVGLVFATAAVLLMIFGGYFTILGVRPGA